MAGKRGRCNADCPAAPVRQNAYNKYAGLFFSVKNKNKGHLFENLSVGKEENLPDFGEIIR